MMQLFTIGLVKLNLDGTTELDGQGYPIATYNSKDVVSFARAWTGFDYATRRSNYEEFDHIGGSYMDPMKIRDSSASWRDWWPKRGLDGKYIGDRYPLCVSPQRGAL